MASEIKVDTIVNAGGDNATGIDLATNDQILLKVANATKLTMNSTGQTTIVGEGGTTTTSVQQGLCKAFVEANDAASFTLSFNISSGSDDGTGDYSYNFTSNLGSADMAMNGTCAQNSFGSVANNQRSASLFGLKLFNSAGTLVDRDHNCSVHGDLA